MNPEIKTAHAPPSQDWLGSDASIIAAVRRLESYAASGLGVGIEMDGHTGIRCQITGAVNREGATIMDAVNAACAAYADIPPHVVGAAVAAQPETASGCTLKNPHIMQCCCNCVHLRAVHHHCCTTPKPEGVIGCVCGVQKGWACAMPEHDRIYDNWPQHSCGCELYTARTPADQRTVRRIEGHE